MSYFDEILSIFKVKLNYLNHDTNQIVYGSIVFFLNIKKYTSIVFYLILHFKLSCLTKIGLFHCFNICFTCVLYLFHLILRSVICAIFDTFS